MSNVLSKFKLVVAIILGVAVIGCLGFIPVAIYMDFHKVGIL